MPKVSVSVGPFFGVGSAATSSGGLSSCEME